MLFLREARYKKCKREAQKNRSSRLVFDSIDYEKEVDPFEWVTSSYEEREIFSLSLGLYFVP
jgi:hypothetical protein